jgi:hypothetical protein
LAEARREDVAAERDQLRLLAVQLRVRSLLVVVEVMSGVNVISPTAITSAYSTVGMSQFMTGNYPP